MKNKFMHLFGFLLLAGTLVFTSCTKDDDTDPSTPSVSFGTGAGFIFEDATIPVNSSFTVNIIATKGSADLKEVAVYKDNVLLGVADIKFDGVDATTNPQSVATFDAEALNWEIEVAGVDHASTHTYRFTVAGTDGLTNSVSVTITTVEQVTTFMGMFWNFSGPNQGGFDLKAAVPGTVPGASTDADIRDRGIDATGNPNNWIQEIEPRNGASLRKAPAAVVFADVTSKEEIKAFFEAGGADLTSSSKIAVGDLYIVKTGDLHVLIHFAQVNPTLNNNEDNYVIDIKR